jgi:two-component system chemotaxis sensor kinase CheA
MTYATWKKISLKAKLTTSFIAVSLIGGGVSSALIDHSVENATRATFEDRLSYETTMLGQMTAGALFGEVDASDESLDGPVRSLGEAVHTQLTVLAKDGTVVADSIGSTAGRARPTAPDVEIESARATGRGVSYRDGRLYVARTIERDGKVLGFARSSVPESEIAVEVREVRTRILFGLIVGLFLALAFGALVSASLTRPLHALSEGARRVGGGDFSRRIVVETEDDIGKLATSFNEMTMSLETTIARLDRRNVDMRRVLDNVDQALLTLDTDGVIAKERSAAVEAWFGPLSAGTRFVDLLARFDAKAATTFRVQWDELRANLMPIEVLLDQLPKLVSHGERQLAIGYSLIGTEDSPAFPEALLVITDVTARLAAERAEEEQREIVAIFERTMRDRAAIVEFLLDAEARVRLLTSDLRPSLIETKRSLHTLKGNAAACGMLRLAALCHTIETNLEESGPDLSKMDRTLLGNAWSYLVARISSFVGEGKAEIVLDDEEYAQVLRALIDGSPRSDVVRMVRDWQRERVVARLERLAESGRQLAARLRKGEIQIQIAKTSLRTPREEWAPFWASLTHVVRNAVDHGLETEEERAQAGKPGAGRLSLSATRIDSEVVVEVADDGRGIDWMRIADRAHARGLPHETQEDLVVALFADGVSSRAEVTSTSGRGIGLGAARDACERLGGYVTIDSQAGVGTAFRFHLPLLDRRVSMRPSMPARMSWRPGEIAQRLVVPDGRPQPPVTILTAEPTRLPSKH